MDQTLRSPPSATGPLRDTDPTLNLRSYYFNQWNSNETLNEAWASGGWLEYTPG
jgi:hypothetical protein